jgi:hypothetical protein
VKKQENSAARGYACPIRRSGVSADRRIFFPPFVNGGFLPKAVTSLGQIFFSSSKFFFIENAFPGFSLENLQNIGVLETLNSSFQSTKLPE